MKKDIHPKYNKKVTFTCACGATFVAGSTIQDDFKTEICSKCHPFYTGKQKLLDTSGRVEKFLAKRKRAEEALNKAKGTKEEPEVEEKAEVEEAVEKPEVKEAVEKPEVKEAPEKPEKTEVEEAPEKEDKKTEEKPKK